jgi:hypothetical protein
MLVVVLLAESYAPVAEEFFGGQDDEFPAQVSFLKFMKFESSDLGKKKSAICIITGQLILLIEQRRSDTYG